MKKRKMETDCHRSQRSWRGDLRYHSNREGANRPGTQGLGNNRVGWSLRLAAGMTSRHHGTSTLLRHVVAARAFRGRHCRARKDARHGRRDGP